MSNIICRVACFVVSFHAQVFRMRIVLACFALFLHAPAGVSCVSCLCRHAQGFLVCIYCGVFMLPFMGTCLTICRVVCFFRCRRGRFHFLNDVRVLPWRARNVELQQYHGCLPPTGEFRLGRACSKACVRSLLLAVHFCAYFVSVRSAVSHHSREQRTCHNLTG